MSTMIQHLQPEQDPLAAHKLKLEFEVSRFALMRVQADFNPTYSIDVGRFKLLFAGLITEAEKLQNRKPFPETLASGDAHIPNIHYNERLNESTNAVRQAIDHLDQACLLMMKSVIIMKDQNGTPHSV